MYLAEANRVENRRDMTIGFVNFFKGLGDLVGDPVETVGALKGAAEWVAGNATPENILLMSTPLGQSYQITKAGINGAGQAMDTYFFAEDEEAYQAMGSDMGAEVFALLLTAGASKIKFPKKVKVELDDVKNVGGGRKTNFDNEIPRTGDEWEAFFKEKYGADKVVRKSKSGIKAIDNAIPNVENATINPKKLTEYALNPNHPVGGNKAKVFESALGYNQSNADDLMRQIYEKLPNSEAVLGQLDEYGQRYTVDIPITGPNGNTVNVRTGWIIKTGSDIPELTTLFVED